ncbi:MAG: OmpA family protein, partial [Daejeonella sp.]
SSNRRGNDDIYRFKKLSYSVTLKGLILDSKTNSPIIGSKILFKRNGITDTIQTDLIGGFSKVLAKASDYEISGRALSYISREEFITTNNIRTDSTISIVLKLDQAEDIQRWVINNCDSLKRSFTLENIYYDLDRAEIREDFLPVLDRTADLMKKNPEISIITASHCDSRASESYNRDLSLRRGRAARAYLMEQGIDGGRIEVKYYGKSRLINPCLGETECSEADQQMNRRTEFEVIINGVNLSQLNCPGLDPGSPD